MREGDNTRRYSAPPVPVPATNRYSAPSVLAASPSIPARRGWR
jgi:hypothetical protein